MTNIFQMGRSTTNQFSDDRTRDRKALGFSLTVSQAGLIVGPAGQDLFQELPDHHRNVP